MATIRKPTQSELNQAPAAKKVRKVAGEAGEIGSALGGGIADTLITIVLFPALFFGLWHGLFILLGGHVIAGVLHLAIGGGALYVLSQRFKRKKDAGRAKQLGCEMASETSANGADNSIQQHGAMVSLGLASEQALAPSQIHFSRQALVSKLIPVAFVSFVFGVVSFSEFGFMFVLCLFFAFRAVVLLLNIVNPSVCLELSARGVGASDLVGFSAEMNWRDVATIAEETAHPLKQHLSLRYGSRKFVKLLGYDPNGAERTLRVPYKMLSLDVADVAALIEKAQKNELAGHAPAWTSKRANPSVQATPSTPSAPSLPQSDLTELRARAQTGFGRKGL